MDPLPHAQGLAPKELAERFGWLEFHPLSDPKLNFRVRAPRGWQARPSEISLEEVRRRERQEYITLAEVGPPDQENVFIRVSYLLLPGGTDPSLEQSLEDYMRSYLPDQILGFDPQNLRSRWGLLARSEKRPGGGKVMEELIEISNQGTGPSISRLLARRKGPLVFVLTCVAPSARYQLFRQAFGVAAASFVLLGEEEKGPLQGR